MKKITCLLIAMAFATFSFGQIQIGADINGEDRYDLSGISVSLSSDGSTLAIGATDNGGVNGTSSGHVRLYKNISGTWIQVGADIDGEAANDNSGSSVSLSSDGTIVAIGSFSNHGDNGIYSGHVRVYENISGTWIQIGTDIDGEAASDLSGTSVSLSSDGSIVAIGAPLNDGDNGYDSGHVRVYKNISGTWIQVGTDIDGEAAEDRSGTSVSLSSDGSIVAIGAHGNDNDNGFNSGHVRVYENLSGTWTQIGTDIDGEATGDNSGTSVSLSSDGSILAIGAYLNASNGFNSGHVRVYENLSGTWTQIGTDIDGQAVGDLAGRSVSLSSNGSVVAIGANESDANDYNSGHVGIYKNISGTWTRLGDDILGEFSGDQSGTSVSLSSDGTIVAIGAPSNNGDKGSYSGHVRVYNLEELLTTDNFESKLFKVVVKNINDILIIYLLDESDLKAVNLYEINGRYLYSEKSTLLSTQNLSSGIYILEVVTTKGKSAQKIVLE